MPKACALAKRILLGLTLFAVMLAAIYGLFQKVPTSFVPDEDQGYVFGVGILPDGASLDRTEAAAAQMSDIFRANPAVGQRGRGQRLQPAGFATEDHRHHAVRVLQGLRRAEGPEGERAQCHPRSDGAIQQDRRSHRPGVQSALDSGSRHHRRFRILDSESRQRRHQATGAR
jgi:multidrug efflux pump subunit AcrB